jgi:hypothetical protein
LSRLPQAVSRHRALLQALIAEGADEFATDITGAHSEGIDAAFSAHILDLYSTSPDESRFWSIARAILSEALSHLDPHNLGFSLSIVRCIPSLQYKTVRCLQKMIESGTPPWHELEDLDNSFLGTESLAGTAVMSGQTHVGVQKGYERKVFLQDQTIGVAAIPILHAQRTAGVLLAISTQPDYFAATVHCELLQNYAALLSLAFRPEDFYEPANIDLQVMPSLQVQQPYLSSLRQRIQATLKTAFTANHPITYPEAQQYAWWQIADELLQR